mgnify:CR=1 FL=1
MEYDKKDDSIKIEMKNIKYDEKEDKKEDEKVEKKEKKSKKKKKKIEMENINNSLEEPFNSDEDMK